MAKAKKTGTVTPYEKGTYCIYIGNRKVRGYKGVKAYTRPGHHLCQVRETAGGKIRRVKTKQCGCMSFKTKVTKATYFLPKGGRKKTKK